jgi:hypothetical protein
MLSVEQFKLRLTRPNHPDWLLVGVDANDDSQLYILSNGGMTNINCAPIELYAREIKGCAQEMITQGKLLLKEDEKSVRIGNKRRVYAYSLKSTIDGSQLNAVSQTVYFSSTFIRWQRSHQLSDEDARKKLGLSADEFHQFREDELNISEALMAKLAEVTSSSMQFWKNLRNRKKILGKINKNI